MREIDDITGAVVDAAIRIHSRLGPGLLESLYEIVLASALTKRGPLVRRQCPISFAFDGTVYPEAFRADLLVSEGRVPFDRTTKDTKDTKEQPLLRVHRGSNCRTMLSSPACTPVGGVLCVSASLCVR